MRLRRREKLRCRGRGVFGGEKRQTDCDGRAVRGAGGAAGDLREIEERLHRRGAGGGRFRGGGGMGFVVLEVRAVVRVGFAAGEARDSRCLKRGVAELEERWAMAGFARACG
jgi:hypothetical protein